MIKPITIPRKKKKRDSPQTEVPRAFIKKKINKFTQQFITFIILKDILDLHCTSIFPVPHVHQGPFLAFMK